MITIPSKQQKELSQIRDALRILAWQEYKVQNNIGGLQAYQTFADEWTQHEIQNFDMKKLTKLVAELGYTLEELLAIRSEYYQRRSLVNNQQPEVTTNLPEVEITEEVPY